jgi:NDP-4-keto-2,6-dideoxyhexose 3-C-methyltransferase
MYKKLHACRICGNKNLIQILDLGSQMLTGIFPKENDPMAATVGPLSLVKCMGDDSTCGLVQLEHSYDLTEMYGMNYGYRSGLNGSMVGHLHAKVKRILSHTKLESGDLVVDIGSNDGTTLSAYPDIDLHLVGVDPTGMKFKSYYQDRIKLIPDFFSADILESFIHGKKAKIITSFSMFYDLENPVDFMKNIHHVLADDGVWIFEQSYLPLMIDAGSYDTVCHEHLEFYCLKQIQFMADKVGFQIIDVEFNDVNGGSFSVTVRKRIDSNKNIYPSVKEILQKEVDQGFDTLDVFYKFATRTKKSRQDLLNFLKEAKKEGKVVAALGASTKGNVLLQYCGLTQDDIFSVGEVNSEKFSCYTPGTWIPIISQQELLLRKPDYLLILPWHFKSFFVKNKSLSGSQLIFPLPVLEVVKVT